MEERERRRGEEIAHTSCLPDTDGGESFHQQHTGSQEAGLEVRGHRSQGSKHNNLDKH